MATSIVIRMTEEEANRIYTLLEPIAMARPLFLNVALSVRTQTLADKRVLRMKRNTADLLRGILEQVDPKSAVLSKVNSAIIAAGGKM
jgi:hypothetical protein